jgi:isopentenyl-diphosphate delta-isomerase
MEVHRKALLHRAFSVFIFNDKGEMLLQKRAATKYHSAGLWTNACCSHPGPGMDILLAAGQRLQEEMGFTTSLQKVFHFTYKAAYDNGLTEYEFDHVIIGSYSGNIVPNPEEVSDFCFKPVDVIRDSLQLDPENYTAWFHIAFPKVTEHLHAVTSVI